MNRTQQRSMYLLFGLFFAFAFIPLHAQAKEDSLTQTVQEKAPSKPPVMGWFINSQARLMGVGQHVSNSLAIQGGVNLFRNLQVGLNFMIRSGPINPTTFDITLPEGVTYKGQSKLDLGSEWTIIGLFLAPKVKIPQLAWLELDFPVVIGVGGAGFYLKGDNRKTPDGKRTSVWENKLMDGRDFTFGPAVDLGLRLMFAIPKVSWFRIGLGLHYSILLGYNSFARPEPNFYNGFSGSLNISFGSF